MSELLSADDATIEAAVERADPMVLRGLIYQLTGDESIAATTIEMAPGLWALELPTLVDPDDVALIRRKAVEFLKAHRDAGAPEIGIGPPERLPVSLGLALGADLPEEDHEFGIETLAIDPWARGLEWTRDVTPEAIADFPVVVIGAGMAGLNAAVQLKRAGVPFTVIEKNAGVGGTWYENRYPGARVDQSSRSYTHVLGVDYDYEYPFFPWEHNNRYFEWMADNFGVREDIVLETEVSSIVWDDDEATWTVSATGPDGPRAWRARAVISAVGFLSRPNLPDIEGAEDFRGVACHTAWWSPETDLAGKRVAVIGTGCTGYQTIPEIAREAAHVHVFQRTAQWLMPTPGYLSPHPPEIPWLDRNLPFHGNFTRVRSILLFESEVLAKAFEIDPDYDGEHARSAATQVVRDNCIAFLQSKLGERPDLLEKMIPPHPPFSARPVCVDEEYSILDALLLDNVSLVTDGLARMTPTGVVTGDGTEIDVDVVMFATGYRANDYLWPMEVRGRDGTPIDEVWAQRGPRAYLGTMIPGFPNFFMIYGPNTNGGLLPASQHEVTLRYAFQCIERLIAEQRRTIEVTEEAYLRHNEFIDERNDHKIWSDPRAASYYYRGGYGRTATQNPLRGTEMWRFLRHPDYDDLVVR